MHSPLFRNVWLLYWESLIDIHWWGIVFMWYCFMWIYLYSDSSISPSCVWIFISVHFYWDVSSSSGALPSHPFNHLSLGLSLEEFGCLYPFGCHRELRMVMLCVMMYILQEESRSDVFDWPGWDFGGWGIQSADLTDCACSFSHCCRQTLTLLPAVLMDWDQQPI